MHHHAKFHQNWSSGCRYIAIFHFSRWRPVAILDFQISLILMANKLQRSQTHHRAKFYPNWSSGCRYIAIYPFFKMAATSRGPTCIIMLNFVKIGEMVAEISRFFDFSKWRPSAIFDLFSAYLDHPWSVFDGLHWCAKFSWNPYSIFVGTRCITMPHFIKMVKRLRIYRHFFIFQDGGRRFQNDGCPPSLICFLYVWTTHEVHLMVFTGVQNLVGIYTVVL